LKVLQASFQEAGDWRLDRSVNITAATYTTAKQKGYANQFKMFSI
jgi:hypothetical protein